MNLTNNHKRDPIEGSISTEIRRYDVFVFSGERKAA